MTIPAVSQDIADMIEADAGLGLTQATNLFIMEWGKEVDAQVLIMDGTGIDSDLKDIYEQPTFQVLVRGKKTDGGITVSDRIRAVHEFLIGEPTRTINGRNYLQFEPISLPTSIGRDENDRPQWSANYFTFRAPN